MKPKASALYNKWLQNNENLSWWEYWQKYTQHWKREDKQRNYKRNRDIIFHTSPVKRNNREVSYEITGVEDDEFYLDKNNLFLKERINTNAIQPYKFISMQVDDGMSLFARMPNVILDKQFEIDSDGNLILVI